MIGVPIEPLPGMDEIAPCEETGSTFEENAILKAEYYGKLADGLLFADDSGLEVDALDGAPGIYSARYAGQGATDLENNRLLLENLLRIENRGARFVCVIALSDRGRLLKTFRGEVEGMILRVARGTEGFGYDPLFYYPPFGRSFGEVEKERKFGVSHRGKALKQMTEYLMT
ncbi:MAG: RdgB/HAM1 family non-canonical purine NTP pyrophosphatase [Acidobacteriota bacterium]|nr:RdgB/HAM1 family non-canonical purine NTP pyrophosphatase [Acidobacteriota bacterium]